MSTPARPGRLRGNPVVRFVRAVVLGAVTLALIAIAVVSVTFSVLAGRGAYRTSTVLTGSMSNLYPVGSVVVLEQVRTASIRSGQIVAFKPPGSAVPVLHRVVRIVDEERAPTAAGSVADTSAGAGSQDRVATSLDDAMLSAPGLRRPDRPQPLVVTKGDANPIVDTWSPVRLAQEVWVPKRVPLFAPDTRLVLGRQIMAAVADPWIPRIIAGVSMLLIGWPLVWRMWRGRSGTRPEIELDELDELEAVEFAASLGDTLDLPARPARAVPPGADGFDDPGIAAPEPRRRRRGS